MFDNKKEEKYDKGEQKSQAAIQQLRVSEQALRASQEKLKIFSSAVENAYDSFVLADMSGNVTYANQSAIKAFGYASSEIAKLNVAQFTANPEDAGKIVEEIQKKGEWSGEVVSIRRNKEKFPCVLSASLIMEDQGNPTAIMGIFRDITQSKKAEEELKDSERKYRTLVESASDQIFMVDKECKLISVNTTALRLFRKKPDEIIGKHISEVFPKEIAEKNLKSLEKVLKTEKSVFVEDKMIVGEHEFWSSTSLNPVKNDSDETIAILGITRDITERKQEEEELKKKISDLERFQRVAVDRELKMIELKKKITELEAKLGEKL